MICLFASIKWGVYLARPGILVPVTSLSRMRHQGNSIQQHSCFPGRKRYQETKKRVIENGIYSMQMFVSNPYIYPPKRIEKFVSMK